MLCKEGHDLEVNGRNTKNMCRLCVNLKCKEYAKKNPDKILDIQFRHHYKISLKEYNDLFQQQNGLCAGCLKHQTQFVRRLAVDHHHKTGRIRGLLCNACNRGIGYLQDNPDILQRLAAYLLSRGY